MTADTHAMLGGRAVAVLRGNDMGSWTMAWAHVYPHQWSWDSAFIAIPVHARLLRKLRTDARLTQEELAEASGVRPRTVSDLERGVAVTPQWETLRRLQLAAPGHHGGGVSGDGQRHLPHR